MQEEVDPCVVEQLKLKLTSHVAVAAAVAPSVAGGVCLLAAALDSLSALRCIMPGWKKNIPACLQPDQEGGTIKPATSVCMCTLIIARAISCAAWFGAAGGARADGWCL